MCSRNMAAARLGLKLYRLSRDIFRGCARTHAAVAVRATGRHLGGADNPREAN